MEYFYSRGQHLCKFIGTKGCVCIRKELNSHRVCLEHQHGRHFIVLGHQYGRRFIVYGRCDVMWKHSILLWYNDDDKDDDDDDDKDEDDDLDHDDINNC